MLWEKARIQAEGASVAGACESNAACVLQHGQRGGSSSCVACFFFFFLSLCGRWSCPSCIGCIGRIGHIVKESQRRMPCKPLCPTLGASELGLFLGNCERLLGSRIAGKCDSHATPNQKQDSTSNTTLCPALFCSSCRRPFILRRHFFSVLAAGC